MTDSSVSDVFRQARQRASVLPAFPGVVPADLGAAYGIQETAIAGWPDRVAGWKVAAIAEGWRATYDAPRLSGPIFAGNVKSGHSSAARMGIIPGGFAAVEAEFAVRIGRDIPPGTKFESEADLLPFIEAVHAAIELAASPLATLNELGPGAVVSDFGNNAGLIVGGPISSFGALGLDAETCAVEIDGVAVGEGSAARIPGGPFGATMFLVEHLAGRGRALHAGDWVSTGAATGIHAIAVGATARALFRGGAVASVAIERSLPVRS